MSENVKKKSDGPNKSMLIAAFVCILIAIGWSAYEITRERTPDEKKEAAEMAKIEADIKRSNAKRGP